MADEIFHKNRRILVHPKQIAAIGDTFFVNGWEYEIYGVLREPLWMVTSTMYGLMGLHTPRDAQTRLELCYGVLDDETYMFVHRFAPCNYPCKGGKA